MKTLNNDAMSCLDSVVIVFFDMASLHTHSVTRREENLKGIHAMLVYCIKHLPLEVLADLTKTLADV